MTIDWLDIALHAVPAILWGAGAGWAAGLGRRYGGWTGTGLAVLGLLSAFGGVWFWPIRELDQHGHNLGGFQSQLEWIVPSVLTALAFFAAKAIASRR